MLGIYIRLAPFLFLRLLTHDAEASCRSVFDLHLHYSGCCDIGGIGAWGGKVDDGLSCVVFTNGMSLGIMFLSFRGRQRILRELNCEDIRSRGSQGMIDSSAS